jgi:tetratricopeptide (TPR) repeat protein
MSTHFNSGWVAYGKGDFQEAVKQFDHAIAQNASDLDGHYGLGLAYKRLGDKNKAAAEFKQALDLAATVDDKEKSAMLVRLLHGHLNFIKGGDWKIGEELWNLE